MSSSQCIESGELVIKDIDLEVQVQKGRTINV